jgi:hypothetical protein
MRTQGGMVVEVTTEEEEEARSTMPGGTFDTLFLSLGSTRTSSRTWWEMQNYPLQGTEVMVCGLVSSVHCLNVIQRLVCGELSWQ